MSRRRRHQPDSLELLLDTMCNTFGGIIMIALLIALLSRDTNSEAVTEESARKQMEQIEKQVTEAEQLQATLRSETDTNASPAMALLTARDELRTKIEEARRVIESNTVTQASIIATNDPAEIQRLVVHRQQQTNELQTLSRVISRETQAHQRQLRLPRERATGKRTFYFIARFGKLYPVHLFRDGRRELNKQTLEWQTTTDGETAVPRAGGGMDVPAFARFLNDVPNGTYAIHFLVYDDSFSSFLAARQAPLARGYDTGWEFLPADRPVVFSSSGEAPPAL
jgi:hypothetical protein